MEIQGFLVYPNCIFFISSGRYFTYGGQYTIKVFRVHQKVLMEIWRHRKDTNNHSVRRADREMRALIKEHYGITSDNDALRLALRERGRSIKRQSTLYLSPRQDAPAPNKEGPFIPSLKRLILTHIFSRELDKWLHKAQIRESLSHDMTRQATLHNPFVKCG